MIAGREDSSQVLESTESSRKDRKQRRANSQKAYLNRKRKLQKIEAANENRVRMAEYTTEKLSTATVNDGRKAGQLLAGLVHIMGIHKGVSSEQVQGILGTAASPVSPLADPPVPDFIATETSEDASDDYRDKFDESDVEKGADMAQAQSIE